MTTAYRPMLKELKIKYYDTLDVSRGISRKFKIYKISIKVDKYPELVLSFTYIPSIEDFEEILSSSIYPTIVFGDSRSWQNACLEKLKSFGLPEVTDTTMISSKNGITIELLHAYIKHEANERTNEKLPG